jgi:hypothetical protein
VGIIDKIQLERTDDDGAMGFLLYGLVELADGTYKIEVREEQYTARGRQAGGGRNEYPYDDYESAREQYDTWVCEAVEAGWSA